MIYIRYVLSMRALRTYISPPIFLHGASLFTFSTLGGIGPTLMEFGGCVFGGHVSAMVWALS